jgi:TolB-like protein/AraC-like DNA-binding protein/thioredoxin-like negative regulator of GroEL
MSADRSQDYFCDGLTEEIIHALAGIEQLKVISRTSAFHFKGQEEALGAVAEQLQVSIVVQGSVRFAKGVARISAQLIRVPEEDHFWSNTWDRTLDDVFAVQDEVSLAIADRLREHVGHMDIAEHLAQTPTRNLSAYEHYVEGKKAFDKWNPAEVQKAIGHFEAALAIDPQMIDAHVGLGDGYSFLAVAGFAPRVEGWASAKRHLELAKSIDPEHPGLNNLLANQALFTKADFKGAMRFAQRALVRKPSYSDAQLFTAFLYMLQGDYQKAFVHLEYARSIDPLNPETRFYEAYYRYRTEDFAACGAILRELLEANPHNVPAIVLMAYIHLALTEIPEMESLMAAIPEPLIMPDERLGLRCLARIMSGLPVDADPEFQTLQQHSREHVSLQADSYLFLCYANLNRLDEAFALVEKAFEQHSSIFLLAFSGPLAKALRSDPRYAPLHQRLYPSPEAVVYEKRSNSSEMVPADAAKYRIRLQRWMEEERPYLNPALTLRGLATDLNLHPNRLSWLLNEQMGINFNAFVNGYRIGHFKELLLDPGNAHISLIGLAFESGFNSKTVFNTTFKKMEGMTPGAYQKVHRPSA